MTQEERYIKMTETPISRLIPSLAIPTIISMLVTSIYNMADTFFVSRISTSASAAVGVSYSLMAMIQALGFTLGMGSGNYLSRVLGSRDEEKAERIASTGFYTAIFVGLAFGVMVVCELVRGGDLSAESGSAGAPFRGHRYDRTICEGLCEIHSDGSTCHDGSSFYE